MAREAAREADPDDDTPPTARKLVASIVGMLSPLDADARRSVLRIVASRLDLDPPPPTGGPIARLSPREREVFAQLIEGHTSAEVGLALCISPKTVETHREHILNKLGLHSMVQLVRFAAQHKLL